ncbi:RNA deprotection pyrophosphohydrolase [Oceanobacillus halotolerans]|uniref:RNA deprotection pyrophosphohydrolase n=1 Tax=Oceanobacillus halotolerans TaxID=2663380 RepID=UPI0013DB2745|nr:nucleoside triphosphatase YtkD [Oceanobacillus halotolerans]
MYTFKDYYNNEVRLSFRDHPFSVHPLHVFVICMYKNRWLLTKHAERGLEFPGGKVEIGETAEQAAVREVYEETGGHVKSLQYIGQYYVKGKGDQITKNVYVAEVDELHRQDTYYETEGPVVIETIPQNIKENKAYSFIMKDDVLTHSLNYIQKTAPNHPV